MVIFKGKRLPADLTATVPDVEVAVQQNGWMTEDIMLTWIRTVLVPYTKHRPTLLVMDSFNAHTTDKVFLALTEANVTPTVIPGGCISKVQPLDVSINKSFKDHLRKLWVQYIGERADADITKLPTASRPLLLEWIQRPWTAFSLNPGMIERAFSTCGITAALEAGSHAATIEQALESDTSDSEFEGFTSSEVDVFSPRGEDPFAS